MARLEFQGQCVDVAASAATPITVFQLRTASNHLVALKDLSFSTKGTVNTDVPVLVELCIQSADGSGESSVTMQKTSGSMIETLQTTGYRTFTSEPLTSTVIRSWRVHPQIIANLIINQELVLKGGTRYGIRVTAAEAQDVSVSVACEE